MKKKLRLLFTPECNRSCRGCCNKDWDLNALPICHDYSGYEEIIITGGEPLLYVEKLVNLLHTIKEANPTARLILYTAKTDHVDIILDLARYFLHGITITLHTIQDIPNFVVLNHVLESYMYDGTLKDKTLRLNVFKQVRFRAHGLKAEKLTKWQIKDNLEWMKDCPLPEDEVFMRSPNI